MAGLFDITVGGSN